MVETLISEFIDKEIRDIGIGLPGMLSVVNSRSLCFSVNWKWAHD